MEWYKQLQLNIQNLSWFEATAMMLGLASVLVLQAGRSWGYIIGILSVVSYIWICYQAKLYAHMGVNAYYVIMNLYGLHHWHRGGATGGVAPYRYCLRWEYLVGGLGFGVVFALLWGLLQFTDTKVAVWDALTTAIWVVAMWWLARKRVENWLAWLLGDLICIPLYFYQGYLLTSIQMFVFCIFAAIGFFRWRGYASKERNRVEKTPVDQPLG